MVICSELPLGIIGKEIWFQCAGAAFTLCHSSRCINEGLLHPNTSGLGRSQHVMLMWRATATRLSGCDVWEVIPLCLHLQSTHRHTEAPRTLRCPTWTPVTCQPRPNRISVPRMTAEPLSLSWLLNVETHTYTNTRSRYSEGATANININSRWPLGSISLSSSLTARDDQTALWHDSDNILMLWRAAPSL